MIYDCIVIGKGPAGITASIYLKRYGFEPLVIAKDGGALEKVATIENYYGISHISGIDLIHAGIDQATGLGIQICEDEVIDIVKEDHFKISTPHDIYESKTVILACGTSRNKYNKVEGLDGVSYCATCDGFFYRKKKVALIGNGNYMAHELSVLENICQDIIVFTDGKPLQAEVSSTIKVVVDSIDQIHGEERITAIEAGGILYPIDGCFIAIGSASAFTFAKHLGLGVKDNQILVDSDFMTNLEGLFSCGDSIGGLLQVSKAVGEGAICATSVSKYLKKHNL